MFAPGAKNRPKSPIDNAWGQLWRVVAQSENFVETYESPHLKRCASKWGKSCTPGGQERPKVAPLTFNGVHHRNGFSIEHNSGSQCHRDKGAGSFDSDDQSASQDHCEAIKPRP